MRETITAALKHATKAQDKRRISTLRLVSAAIKDRDIAARTAGKTQATDAELLELFAKMIKQREESEKIYAGAGRAELAKQESEEIAIIREFLPKQLSDQEMEKAIADAIAKSGAASVKDMGKVMKAALENQEGKLNGIEDYIMVGFCRLVKSDPTGFLCNQNYILMKVCVHASNQV